ncbi:hypothetical protein EGH24_04490 [Halonotius terrestris]|uniref:DUF7999 domain-containing protein n=1 Tax=Halonotius terrestris TaxID=2487750 RepID=A0A8J8TBT7_9EURY|nr:hypothetical protein [Halonotius terrestris]TQQ82710.1 hypothetical protein EGH24_04490 [Halonotius terrestris]
MSSAQLQVVTCTIKRPMNSHGALMLAAVSGCRTFHVVEYDSPRIQATLARRNRGTTVRVCLQRVESRGEAWRVTGLEPTASHSKPNQSLSPSKGPIDAAGSGSSRLPLLR